MADITKCNGGKCIIKNECKRYQLKKTGIDMVFKKPPFKVKNGIFSCEMFRGRNSDNILNVIKDIFKK